MEIIPGIMKDANPDWSIAANNRPENRVSNINCRTREGCSFGIGLKRKNVMNGSSMKEKYPKWPTIIRCA